MVPFCGVLASACERRESSSRLVTPPAREASRRKANHMPKQKTTSPAGIGRNWVPVVNQRVRLKRENRGDWEERAMTVTVTSINSAKRTFSAEGIGGGGQVAGRSKAFRLLGVCFSEIEALLEVVTRTRGVGSMAMIKKKRRRAPAAVAAATAAGPTQAAATAPTAATTPPAAPTAASKADFLRTELGVPGHYTIAEVTAEAERQLGLTPSAGDKVGQRLDRAYQELC